ncbi:MAG: hypothetical protein ACYCTE_10815 [Acidimicrobiales bacterium]
MTEIARTLAVPVSTAHRALDRPAEIGAVTVHTHRGLRVVNPWRLLMLWAARRDLAGDVVARTTTSLTPWQTERLLLDEGAIIGGFGGAVARLGENPIGPYDTVFAYGEAIDLPGPGATTVLTLKKDPLLARYGEVAPLAQCFVDLFNTPGWKAARFVETLSGRLGDSDVAA